MHGVFELSEALVEVITLETQVQTCAPCCCSCLVTVPAPTALCRAVPTGPACSAVVAMLAGTCTPAAETTCNRRRRPLLALPVSSCQPHRNGQVQGHAEGFR